MLEPHPAALVKFIAGTCVIHSCVLETRGCGATLGRGPTQTDAPRNISNRALGRAHSRPAVARGDWISDGAGLFPSGFPSPPTSLVFLLKWWGSLVLGEFGAATLDVAGWVSERVYWTGRRPSPSPCDRLNCVLDDESRLGFAVILSPVGEGWAVG